MKGNRTLKKYLAMAMAIVFVVSGIVFTPKSTNAAAPDATWTAVPADWGDISAGFTGYAGGAGGGITPVAYHRVNSSDSNAMDVYLETAPNNEWGLQFRYKTTSLTAGGNYQYTLTFTADKAGSIYTKEELGTGSQYKQVSYAASTETSVTNTFKANTGGQGVQVLLANFPGAADDTTFTGIKITFTEVQTTTQETTTRGETEGNIIDGATWHGWFEKEGWNDYDICTAGEAEDGYTLTNKNIGGNWYSIQTGIDGVLFTSGKEYTIDFTLTAAHPKSFVVDNRTNDTTIFTETAASKAVGWVDNGDNTYSYRYIGTFNGDGNSYNLRVSLGYNAAKTSNAAGSSGHQTDAELEGYSENASLSITMSNVIITPTSEYNPGDGYNDATCDGYAKYQANGWGYMAASDAGDIGFRTGTYDDVTYKMELKNRNLTAKTLHVMSKSDYSVEEGKVYKYTINANASSSAAISARMTGFYFSTTVLNWMSVGTISASGASTLTGTFTALETATGSFQIELANVPAEAEVGIVALTIEEASPWEMIDTYGSFTDRGFWEYYVDSNGEAYYDTTNDPNTAEEVGFKYVKESSSANSNRYRMRTAVLSDSEGNFNVGDYYDYSFTIGIDSDSTDALANGHIKVVEYTGDSATDFVTLQEIPAVNINNSEDIHGTCGATVNGSRIGIVVSQEDDISLHITDFEVTRRGNTSDILKSTKVAIEGFQIQSNNTGASVSYRTLCRAPRIGTGITVDGETYTVAALGTSYALDPNADGNNEHNSLNDTYTVLDTDNPVTGQQYKYEGVKKYNEQNRTYGYEATEAAIIDGWKEGDTANAYYAFTMQGMDDVACNTLWVRPFVKATKTVEGVTETVFIYGTITAYTSVAEIADHLYGNSLAKNITSHQYLYSILNNSSIVPTSNPHHRYATGTESEHGPVTYGWSNSLYIGFRLVPDTFNGSTEEMQYVNIEDWKVHANSSYTGGSSVNVPGTSASYKGVTNDEMMVRIETPGHGLLDQWGNIINWGLQIRLPNRVAYDRLVDGKYYRMTVRYKTTKAGIMRIKYEGNPDLEDLYRDAEYDGHKEAYIRKVTNQQVGYNEFYEEFQYHDSISHGQNDASIVIVPCGSLGSDDGFPAGTILSEFSITFDEIPAP